MTTGDKLVGRERELAEASAAANAALAGNGCLVLLGGEAGIGKTRLLESLVADLAGRGTAAVWAACWDGMGVPPFWPWIQILRECARTVGPGVETGGARGGGGVPRQARAPDLARLVAGGDELLVDAGAEAPVGELSEQLRLRLFDSVAMFLEQAAESRPLVLVFDDLQWADTSSLRLLRFLAQRLRRRPIAVLASHRYPDLDEGSPFAAEFGDLVRTARTLTLYGLDYDAARELIRQTTRADPGEDLVASVHERTAGNPLFITEIIRLLAAQGRLAMSGQRQSVLPIPISVRNVIAQRLHHVSQPCRQLLSCASVLGEEFLVEVLESMADQHEGPARPAPEAEQVAGLLEEGVRAGLLVLLPGSAHHRYRFSHALVREALYGDLPPSLRSVLHRRAGEAIEERFQRDLDARLGELAYHFLMAAGDDPSKALGYVQRAGEQALSLLAYEEAADHFARAVDVAASVDESARAELLLRLGDARLRAGDWDGAVAAYEEAATSARRRGDAHQLARAALGLGTGLSGFEVPLFDQRQLDLLQEALDSLGNADTRLRARILARLSVATSFIRSAGQRAELSRQAIDVARRVGDREALAYALSSYCDAIAGPAHTEERLTLATEIVELGQETGNREMELLGRRFRLVAQLELGNIAAVDAEIEAFARVAGALGVPLYRWYVPLWRGMRAIMEGRLADCEQLLARARAIGEQAHSRNAAVLTDAQRNLWLLESGQAAEASRRMESYLDDPERGPNVAGVLVSLLARTGQRARAAALLTRLAADDFEIVFEDTFSVAALCFAADAAADLGDRDAAARLYRKLSPYARRFGISGIGNSCIGSVSRFLGRLAHSLEQWEAADDHFRDALDDHQRASATLFIAHTLRDRAAMLFDRNAPADRQAATANLDEAIAIYRELGLQGWVEHAEQLRPTGAVPNRTDSKPNTFRREGNVWTLVYGGAEAHVKDAKGLQVIARLLAHPGKEFHVLDLLVPTGTGHSHWGGRDDMLAETGDAGEVLDARATRVQGPHYGVGGGTGGGAGKRRCRKSREGACRARLPDRGTLRRLRFGGPRASGARPCRARTLDGHEARPRDAGAPRPTTPRARPALAELAQHRAFLLLLPRARHTLGALIPLEWPGHGDTNPSATLAAPGLLQREGPRGARRRANED